MAARQALRCSPLAELLDAVTEPLTVERAARNIVSSVRLHGMRLPADPASAVAALCGDGTSQPAEAAAVRRP
jgi:hypothetical protein